MIMERQFKRYYVRLTEGELHVRNSRGSLTHPVGDYTPDQQVEIFNSKVPEALAERDLHAATGMIQNIIQGE